MGTFERSNKGSQMKEPMYHGSRGKRCFESQKHSQKTVENYEKLCWRKITGSGPS